MRTVETEGNSIPVTRMTALNHDIGTGTLIKSGRAKLVLSTLTFMLSKMMQ